MSAFLFFQETATITIPVWQGVTGVGIMASVFFGVRAIFKSTLDKKVDKEVFKQHVDTDNDRYDELNSTTKIIEADVKKILLLLPKNDKK